MGFTEISVLVEIFRFLEKYFNKAKTAKSFNLRPKRGILRHVYEPEINSL